MALEIPVASTKRAWHEDLVASPETHAWVLNLYRAGERHPETVTDYFPIDAAPSSALREAMTRHRRDEQRHAGLYAHAVELLGQPVEDFTGLDVFNNAIRACGEDLATFAIGESMSARERTSRLAGFLCHAHFLEVRIAQSLEYHLEACEKLAPRGVTRVVESVLRDEARHARYTIDAARELLPRREFAAILSRHRRAERRANLLFSSRQVRRFLARFPAVGRRADRLRYSAGALLMDGGLLLV